MSQFKDDIVAAETVYFWFAANLTTGAAGDGATPLYDVRLAGGAAGDAPVASGTPTLLTHANYTDGLHEIAVDTTGYANGEYAVFCTLTISTVNPAGFVGSFQVRTANRIDGLTTELAKVPKSDGTATWNATALGSIQTEANDAIVANRLDELLAADSDIDGAAPPTIGSVFHELMTKTAGSFTYDQTTDSLEAIRDKETDIETDTAEIGAAGAGLTNINLPDQTMNITGNLSGSVGSVTAGVTVTANSDKTGYGLADDAITAAKLAADAGAEIADAILDRDMSTGTDSGSTTVRTVRQALRFLRNKWSISGTTLTVTKEDDATTSHTAELGTTSGADPVTSVDPAGP